MPRLLCVIVKSQVDKCAAYGHRCLSFLIMLVSFMPLDQTSLTLVTFATRLAGEKGASLDGEQSPPIPTLDL